MQGKLAPYESSQPQPSSLSRATYRTKLRLLVTIKHTHAQDKKSRGLEILSSIPFEELATTMASNPQSTNGSESEFEFIETPKAPTPTFEKFEECGVRTTSVSSIILTAFIMALSHSADINWLLSNTLNSTRQLRMLLSQQTAPAPKAFPTPSSSPFLPSSPHTCHGNSAAG